MNTLVEFLQAITQPFLDAIMWYFDMILKQPLQLLVYIVIAFLVTIAARAIFGYGRSWVVDLIKSDILHAQIYEVLTQFRDAKDYLKTAASDLEFTDEYTQTVLVGKVPSTRYVPAEYPNPRNAKACLEQAIDLLEGHNIDLTAISKIGRDLPDDEELEVYQCELVDEDTFENERGEIWYIIGVSNGRIQHLEAQLPTILVWSEKLMQFCSTTATILLWFIGLVGGATVGVQILFFGIQLLLRPSALTVPR